MIHCWDTSTWKLTHSWQAHDRYVNTLIETTDGKLISGQMITVLRYGKVHRKYYFNGCNILIRRL